MSFLALLSFSSCSNDGSKSNEDKDSTITQLEEKMDKIESEAPDSLNTKVGENAELGVEYTAKYICPNHCKGSGSDKQGECKNPDCGMELMENPNYKEK
ncbi:MAG: hypothetical protein HC831_02995 [Chloroflexia bacterium]|nr:hypothetical protein [Chloroflexia bacterium]